MAAILLASAGCRHAPDEQRLSETVVTMQRAVEAREPRRFMDHVDATFTANDGTLDREGLHDLLRAEVLRNERIGVTLGPAEVVLHGDRATLNLTVTLIGGASWIPERGAVYAVESGWKKVAGQWRCIGAHWTQKL